jgi:signal transduction histidine kinase
MSRATLSQAGAARTASGFDEQPEDGRHSAAVEEVRELRHEVGNALTAAAAYAQWLLLQRSPDPDEREYRALKAIRDSVARAIRLLDRSETPRQPVSRSLPDLVRLAFDQMPSARHCDVQIRRLTQERIVVSADPDAVIQIVTNVLSNAAKYSPHGTPIEVELNRVDGKGLVTVRDRGIGFEPELKDAIFDGYRTTQARHMADGQGIGLRLSRRLARDAGGCLWGTSSPGHGTAFHLELPLSLAVLPQSAPPPPQTPDEPLASWCASPVTPCPASFVAGAAPR